MSPARSSKRERGVALLMVIITLTLVTSVVVDFQYSSRVDLQIAFNARDELQAEYNALSALRLRGLLLRQSKMLESALNGVLQQLSGDSQMKIPIGQILESVPVECSLLSAVLRQVDGGDDEGGEDFFPGECTATSKSEHSKVSINMLARSTNNISQHITQMLLGLLSERRLERHFQEDDRNGTHAESPEQLVGAIVDWIDRDKNEAGNAAGDEDRHYAYLRDSYRAKNAPFDSVAELQLVHGIDDELYALLKDHVTIYSDGAAIELATATPDRILVGLLSARRPEVAPERLVAGLAGVLRALADMRQGSLLPGLGSLNVATLTSVVQSAGLDSVIDTARLKEVFTDRAGSTWYTVEAQGRVGNAVRTLRAVFQASEGQFYYFRME